MSEVFGHTDEGVQQLLAKVGVASDFFTKLLKEDDWSFVIKLHALFEAACTHLLLCHFREPDLADRLSRLELSNVSVGKVAFLKDLGLLGKRYRRLIRDLSQLRNSLVHDVRTSQFSIKSYVDELSTAKRRYFAESFAPYEMGAIDAQRKMPTLPFPNGVSKENIWERVELRPKEHIWIGAHSALVEIVNNVYYSDYLLWVKARDILENDA